ncbi:hypothetical protein ZWY2020_016996 [Hordeum vulgare]|nr:hypothetical protein ZWY2020_016996 [Hordeum vulgare]
MLRCCRVIASQLAMLRPHKGNRDASRFCTAGFELPEWFRNPKKDGDSFDEDDHDEFVLPIKSNPVEERSHGGGSSLCRSARGCLHEDAELKLISMKPAGS